MPGGGGMGGMGGGLLIALLHRPNMQARKQSRAFRYSPVRCGPDAQAFSTSRRRRATTSAEVFFVRPLTLRFVVRGSGLQFDL
jgi:hypothetical protein